MGDESPAGDATVRSRLSLFLSRWYGRLRSKFRFEYIEGDAATAMRSLRERVAELQTKVIRLESEAEVRDAEVKSARRQVEVATETSQYAIERLRALTAVEVFNRHGAVIDPEALRGLRGDAK